MTKWTLKDAYGYVLNTWFDTTDPLGYIKSRQDASIDVLAIDDIPLQTWLVQHGFVPVPNNVRIISGAAVNPYTGQIEIHPAQPLPQNTGPSETPKSSITNIESIRKNTMVYRFFIETAPGRIDTGASYPACSRANPSGCNPVQFATIQDALDYAKSKGETLVKAASGDEAFDIIEGKQPLNTANIVSSTSDMVPWGTLATVALIAWKWLKG